MEGRTGAGGGILSVQTIPPPPPPPGDQGTCTLPPPHSRGPHVFFFLSHEV
jgi:hypothetical protein